MLRDCKYCKAEIICQKHTASLEIMVWITTSPWFGPFLTTGMFTFTHLHLHRNLGLLSLLSLLFSGIVAFCTEKEPKGKELLEDSRSVQISRRQVIQIGKGI